MEREKSFYRVGDPRRPPSPTVSEMAQLSHTIQGPTEAHGMHFYPATHQNSDYATQQNQAAVLVPQGYYSQGPPNAVPANNFATTQQLAVQIQPQHPQNCQGLAAQSYAHPQQQTQPQPFQTYQGHPQSPPDSETSAQGFYQQPPQPSDGQMPASNYVLVQYVVQPQYDPNSQGPDGFYQQQDNDQMAGNNFAPQQELQPQNDQNHPQDHPISDQPVQGYYQHPSQTGQPVDNLAASQYEQHVQPQYAPNNQISVAEAQAQAQAQAWAHAQAQAKQAQAQAQAWAQTQAQAQAQAEAQAWAQAQAQPQCNNGQMPWHQQQLLCQPLQNQSHPQYGSNNYDIEAHRYNQQNDQVAGNNLVPHPQQQPEEPQQPQRSQPQQSQHDSNHPQCSQAQGGYQQPSPRSRLRPLMDVNTFAPQPQPLHPQASANNSQVSSSSFARQQQNVQVQPQPLMQPAPQYGVPVQYARHYPLFLCDARYIPSVTGNRYTSGRPNAQRWGMQFARGQGGFVRKPKTIEESNQNAPVNNCQQTPSSDPQNNKNGNVQNTGTTTEKTTSADNQTAEVFPSPPLTSCSDSQDDCASIVSSLAADLKESIAGATTNFHDFNTTLAHIMKTEEGREFLKKKLLGGGLMCTESTPQMQSSESKTSPMEMEHTSETCAEETPKETPTIISTNNDVNCVDEVPVETDTIAQPTDHSEKETLVAGLDTPKLENRKKNHPKNRKFRTKKALKNVADELKNIQTPSVNAVDDFPQPLDAEKDDENSSKPAEPAELIDTVSAKPAGEVKDFAEKNADEKTPVKNREPNKDDEVSSNVAANIQNIKTLVEASKHDDDKKNTENLPQNSNCAHTTDVCSDFQKTKDEEVEILVAADQCSSEEFATKEQTKRLETLETPIIVPSVSHTADVLDREDVVQPAAEEKSESVATIKEQNDFPILTATHNSMAKSASSAPKVMSYAAMAKKFTPTPPPVQREIFKKTPQMIKKEMTLKNFSWKSDNYQVHVERTSTPGVSKSQEESACVPSPQDTQIILKPSNRVLKSIKAKSSTETSVPVKKSPTKTLAVSKKTKSIDSAVKKKIKIVDLNRSKELEQLPLILDFKESSSSNSPESSDAAMEPLQIDLTDPSEAKESFISRIDTETKKEATKSKSKKNKKSKSKKAKAKNKAENKEETVVADSTKLEIDQTLLFQGSLQFKEIDKFRKIMPNSSLKHSPALPALLRSLDAILDPRLKKSYVMTLPDMAKVNEEFDAVIPRFVEEMIRIRVKRFTDNPKQFYYSFDFEVYVFMNKGKFEPDIVKRKAMELLEERKSAEDLSTRTLYQCLKQNFHNYFLNHLFFLSTKKGTNQFESYENDFNQSFWVLPEF